MTFEAVEGGTLMSVVQTGLPNVEIRDFFEKMAWAGAFDRIDAYLRREAGMTQSDEQQR